ncbi:MAG: translation initiation factor IF-3 [Planctomycetota bacterium]
MINEAITAREILLVDDDNNNLGVKDRLFALALANEKGLDLVIVNPNVTPPVCKLIDYGRFKFKKEKHRQKARKIQHTTKVRELRVKSKIEENDLMVKFRKMQEFIAEGDKVRFNLFIKGREFVHANQYKDKVFGRLMELAQDIAEVEEEPLLENNKYTILFTPRKSSARTDDGNDGGSPHAPSIAAAPSVPAPPLATPTPPTTQA